MFHLRGRIFGWDLFCTHHYHELLTLPDLVHSIRRFMPYIERGRPSACVFPFPDLMLPVHVVGNVKVTSPAVATSSMFCLMLGSSEATAYLRHPRPGRSALHAWLLRLSLKARCPRRKITILRMMFTVPVKPRVYRSPFHEHAFYYQGRSCLALLRAACSFALFLHNGYNGFTLLYGFAKFPVDIHTAPLSLGCTPALLSVQCACCGTQ
jgi:hypothetical protein